MNIDKNLIKYVKVWELANYYNIEIVLKDNLFTLNLPVSYYNSIHFDVVKVEEVYKILCDIGIKSFLLIKGCYSDGIYEKDLSYLENIKR